MFDKKNLESAAYSINLFLFLSSDTIIIFLLLLIIKMTKSVKISYV